MHELKIVLQAISEGALNPGEVVLRTRLPRYEVLAIFHVLEGLGLIETIYSKGSHKVYTLTQRGEEVLEGLSKGGTLEVKIKTVESVA
ncbi:MAG: hypothetical protein RXS23_07135 [Metallosphaera yellowstonensis]|jgi:hypothetical protein|uniref:Transcriptional regulator n=1 Tax=Metallosphaera yellowstonensis MK1 TaxID=671065 RepID=H2C8W0_9CREN|nr:hypothetical protein [Metallosphaera yellowstonensis]EHP68586.1 hypothetical protein MetMK1DRAFT_00030290 [Metallosphaera yellowstonensis MK1]